jgi:regulator of replication initiation timing
MANLQREQKELIDKLKHLVSKQDCKMNTLRKEVRDLKQRNTALMIEKEDLEQENHELRDVRLMAQSAIEKEESFETRDAKLTSRGLHEGHYLQYFETSDH